MKIVKFNDGTYAVRRLNLTGWEYLGYDANGRFYWWPLSYIRHSRVSTLEKAEKRMAAYKAPQPKDDVGTPVRKKTLIPPLGGSVPRCNCNNQACR